MLELLLEVTTRGVVVLFVAGLVYVLVVEVVPGLVYVLVCVLLPLLTA